MRIAIALEERELHKRFGVSYEEYCRRVPRFVPSFAKAAETADGEKLRIE
jgi:protein-S-isoprenylcysteine O-methyltransferase Ste14